MTSSSASHTSPRMRSTIFFAVFTLVVKPRSTSRFITNGLKSSSAISFGNPHWWSLRYGFTTITDRPE